MFKQTENGQPAMCSIARCSMPGTVIERMFEYAIDHIATRYDKKAENVMPPAGSYATGFE